MLLDEVESLFDFATSESCIGDAPPRMKVGLLLTLRAYQATFMGVSRVAMSHLIP
jgi:hypothetical protein